MDINLDRRARGYSARRRRNRIWKKLVTALGCLVVFCTTYALILPAITMEREPVCGLSEHVHSDSCYSRQRGALTCTLAESEGHTHTDACKGTKRVLSCTTPESDGHTHGEGCYDAEGVLTCTLPETQGHHHSDSCYRTEEAFVCGKAESAPHHHTDECYAWETVATCGSQEHTHTDSCYPTKPAETTGATEMPADSTTDATTAATENTETAEPMEEMLLLQEEVLALSAEGTEPLPGVKISAITDAVYDSSSNKFETKIHIDFRIPGSASPKTATYFYDYPDGIEIPESLLDQNHPMTDGRGTYRFEKVNGVYRLLVKLSDAVAASHDDVTGFVDFNGTLDATKVDEKGRIVLGDVDNQLIIDRNKIDYPSNETERYDISASKRTDGNIDNGKLTYQVTISTEKGTPSPIQFTDTIQAAGMTLGKPVVKVDGQEHPANWTWNAETGTGTITMDNLPGLNKGQHYKIEYTYDVTDYPAAVMEPKNSLIVKAKDEGRNQEVKDDKNKDISTKIDKTHTAAKVGKLEGSRIQWTITLNSNRSDITGATLTDKMFKNLSADSSITVSPNNGYTLQDGTITFDKVNGKENNQRYTITYYTDAPEDDTVTEVKNEAKFDPDPDDPKDDIEMKVRVGVGIDAAKSGTYNANQGTITWVITVNAKQRNIAGAVLTDDMLTHAQANSIQVTPTSGYQIITDESGKVSITFQPVDGETNTNTYKITYTTAASPALVARTVSNTAHLKKGDHEEEVTAEVTIDGDGSVDKSSGTLTLSQDKTTGVLPWTVTIHVPAGGIPKGTVLEDSIGAGNTDIYMTNDQVKNAVAAFCQALGIQLQDVKVDIQEYVWSSDQYVYNLIDSYTNVQFRKLTLTLLKDVPTSGQEQDISVTYDTTLKIDPDKMTQAYSNYFKAGGWEKSAQFEYWRSGVEKTDDKGNTGTSTVTSQGDLVWKVIVTLDDTSRQFLDITDTLPTDVTLAELKLIWPIDQWRDNTANMTIGEDGKISGQDGPYQVSGTYNKDTRQVSLKVTAVNGGNLPTKTKLTFVFGCQTPFKDNATHTFTNKVDVAEIGSDSQTQDWTYDNQDTETAVLGKTGSWDNHSRTLSYKVDINPNSKKLSKSDGTGKLTLVDTLTHKKKVWVWIPAENGQDGDSREFAMDVSLVQNSVKLYQVTENEDGTTTKTPLSVHWTFEEQLGNEHEQYRKCILRMDVPDGTHLLLEYQYQVEINAPENGINDKLWIENTVELVGTGYEKKADDFPQKWEESETSGQVTSGRTLAIYKVAKGDFGTVLPGAQFTVYTVDTSTSPYTLTKYDSSTFSNPMITDASGRLIIRFQDQGNEQPNFAYDTLYALQETQAPPGYRLPDEPQVFYFYFSNPDSAARAIPQNLPPGAMDLSQTDQQKFVENEPVPTYELPDTGGGGTRGFTLGGALVTVGGLYLLTRKKRRRRDA